MHVWCEGGLTILHEGVAREADAWRLTLNLRSPTILSYKHLGAESARGGEGSAGSIHNLYVGVGQIRQRPGMSTMRIHFHVQRLVVRPSLPLSAAFIFSLNFSVSSSGSPPGGL